MIALPPPVEKTIEFLEKAGFEAYIVGGCVRDSLLRKNPQDYDIATSALPGQTMEVFAGISVIETGIRHGTVTVLMDGMPIEVTTYRIDTAYSDHRRPDTVCFTRSLREDAARRDFTINALAYHPNHGVLDFFDGQEDLKRRIIRCVGQPDRRFEEDALRILRALRFSSALGFFIEERTAKAIHRNRALLCFVSAQRLQSELTKLLCGRDVRRVLLEYADVLGVVLPELLPMKGFDQKNPHHCFEILEHTAVAVEKTPPRSDLRWAALLHDIGKPDCFSEDQEGVGHFYGHAAISKEKAAQILDRLKFENAMKVSVTDLVSRHDLQIMPEEKQIRRLLGKLTPAGFFDLLALQRADNLAQSSVFHDRQQYYDRIEETAYRILEEQQCFSLRQLAVNGRDLIALGIAPGKQIGELLHLLLEAVIDGNTENKRDTLLDYLYQSGLLPDGKSDKSRVNSR